MKTKELRFAPRDIFEHILEYAVIPTFDIIVNFEKRGVILVRRRIAPYKNTWALPGLRMMKPENIGDTVKRIARYEIGINIDPAKREFIGQYVGRFKSEHQRQDISTCYALHCSARDVALNKKHFSGCCFINGKEKIPAKTGAMYRHFLESYFALKNQ